jgi:hypothetical protein
MGFFVEEVQQLEEVQDLDLDHWNEHQPLNLEVEERQVHTQEQQEQQEAEL